MKRFVRSILGLSLMSMAALSGCGGDVSGGGSGGTGGAGGGSGGSGGGAGGAGGAGSECGGFSGMECAVDQFCDFSKNECGAVDQVGTCKPRPQACDASYMPACGCNGTVYGNTCAANADGQDVSNLGCAPPDATLFACGPGFCQKGSDYCQRAVSDVGSEADSFGCKPLPPSCGSPASCDCLANEPCGSMCEALPSGDLKVTCPGG